MLTLYKFGPVWGVPDASPFCMKLETYLRMTGIPFEVKKGMQNMKLSPKGKMPFIEHEGKRIGDSELIIGYLKKTFGDSLDGALSPEQKAIARLIQRTLDEHCYFAAVHSRWIDEANWPVVRETFFRPVPALLRGLVSGQIRKKVGKMLYLQGAGRHESAELYAMAIEDLQAVLSLLGDQPYLFGDAPSSADACLHAYLANFLIREMRSPMADFLAQDPRVAAYVARIDGSYYGNAA
ncbi:MAG: glutathione S-transferase family protein [Gammaproteobacteria bacterium]|nr:glutathione S-transferase family protein [Gammaproteobacteria bacterium]